MRLRRLVVPGILAIAAYFAIFGGDYSVFSMWRLERQQEVEAAALERLRAELDSLRARADSLETDSATLERIARERYGLIRDGERLYRFVDPIDAAVDTAETPDDR